MKELVKRSGIDGKNIMLLLTDAQMKPSFVLEDINNLLNQGEIPNLYAADEKAAFVEKLRPIAKKDGRMDLYNKGVAEQFFDFFAERTRAHLHIVMAMSPIGNTLRERVRNFPSVVNCCTIDYYTEWPDEALEAVAENNLDEIELEEKEKTNIIHICKKMHNDVKELSGVYLREHKRYNYVTPTTYLDLVLTYNQLMKSQGGYLKDLQNDYNMGINKLVFTANEVERIREDINEKQPKLR